MDLGHLCNKRKARMTFSTVQYAADTLYKIIPQCGYTLFLRKNNVFYPNITYKTVIRYFYVKMTYLYLRMTYNWRTETLPPLFTQFTFALYTFVTNLRIHVWPWPYLAATANKGPCVHRRGTGYRPVPSFLGQDSELRLFRRLPSECAVSQMDDVYRLCANGCRLDET